jgi:hypothetical protein
LAKRSQDLGTGEQKTFGSRITAGRRDASGEGR